MAAGPWPRLPARGRAGLGGGRAARGAASRGARGRVRGVWEALQGLFFSEVVFPGALAVPGLFPLPSGRPGGLQSEKSRGKDESCLSLAGGKSCLNAVLPPDLLEIAQPVD